MSCKKVLHVFNILNRGGAETFIYNIYKQIDKNKYKFDFLLQSQEIGAYEKEFKKMGSQIYHLKKFKSSQPLRTIKESVSIIKQNGPYDAIHIPMQFYSSIYCIAAKKAGVKKIIVHSHNANDKNQKNIIRHIYQKISQLIINAIATDKVSCGEEAGKYLFGRDTDYTVIHNGIDLKKFSKTNQNKIEQLRKEYNISTHVVIGEIARFAEQKNQKFFIRIAKELVKRGTDFKIVLAGDGPEKKKIEAEIKKANMESYFIMPGVIQDTNTYYRLFNVLVMPSLYEGFPVTVIEAISCATPCILSSKITREASIADEAVRFIDLDAPIKEWCDSIIDMSNKHLDGERLRIKLKQKGFNIESTVKQIEKLYEDR